jgi:putative ABC transport system ATP-binding protein
MSAVQSGPGAGVCRSGPEPVVDLSDVGKSYDGGVTALSGVCLSILAGEAIAITGPSGSGKSTLLNMIGMLDRPTSGTVTVRGRRTEGLSDSQISALCGKELGLGHRINHRPHEMSGGERQRVAIARAIAHRPSFLLADEPTGALDSANGHSVMALLHELNQDGTTLVVMTHDRAIAEQLPRRITVRDGRIVGEPS